MSDSPSTNRPAMEEPKRLLARVSVIRGACELDLLVFLHRHPRTLLTNEQLAAFVGYDMKQVAKAVDAFIDAGLLERTQNPMHAARMYFLVIEGPQAGGYKGILKLASTRQGRQQLLALLAHNRGRAQTAVDIARGKRGLHAIA